MSDIELVIKLDKDIAQGIIGGENDAPRNIVRAFQATIAAAIKYGTPLPKGHGRIKDVDKIISDGINKGFCDWYNEMKHADTIIEADRAESER